MFEKEAEEYGIENCRIQKNGLCAFVDSERTSKIWQEGATFGYNKANEWHYVKDGDLPKENQLVLMYRENSLGSNIALSYWYQTYMNDKDLIAWKEIVLPKESE